MYTNPLWRTNKLDGCKRRQTDIAGYAIYDDLAVHRLNRAAKILDFNRHDDYIKSSHANHVNTFVAKI